MKKANKVLTEVDASRGLDGIHFSLRKIELKEIQGKLFWKGTAASSVFYCSGELCLPIKPSIDLNPPADMTKFFFDINLMRDMSVYLKLQTDAESKQVTENSSNSSILTKPCYICRKKLQLKDMLCHVGTHILKGDVDGANICGFCGCDNICGVTLKITSRKRGKCFYGIDKCDCKYFHIYGKAKKFNKKNNPCTNRILRCPISKCLSNVWIYNYQQHFNEKHDNEEYPPEMMIDAAEVDFHKSKK